MDRSRLSVTILLVLSIFIQSNARGQSLKPEPFGRRTRAVETNKTLHETKTRFLLFRETNRGCQIQINRLDRLQECGFNSSLPLVMIIHGWSESVQFSRSHVHLIGYSLGAHVSGFAGSSIGGTRKIGRITGLDPAGPLFEGSSPSDRLSPDDANFVDAIHTFTREYMGLSVGIKQPIGHYDFYPNGGSFQPGCHFLELYRHIAQHGFNAITQAIKCSHERSVHLFIDSLLHAGTQSTAYLCRDMDSFSQGLCLSCKKGRCNTLGYHVRQEPRSQSKRLFLVTRAQSPFKVYHYNFKIHFINQSEKPIETTFTMSLLGTKEKMQKIPITLDKGIASNKTYSFLITLEVDIGELIMIKFKWESSAVWADVWNTVQTIIPWGTRPRHSGLLLKTIRVKAGETQQRMTFCSENTDDLQLHPTQEKIFVKCELKSKKSKQNIR
uniref:Hepatic triacylglycerol lipase n=1 Tax=Aotus nancymaae TaxID=37293 RepID=A0A2K5E890_AOTNA